MTSLSEDFAVTLVLLIGPEAEMLRNATRFGIKDTAKAGEARDVAIGQVQWEQHLIKVIGDDESLPETERESVIIARRGQGRFKEAVMQIESRCRITKVNRIEHLRASHIRPWRDCEDHGQRLDGSNGLLLTPSIDHLFDRGFISFENHGELLVSPVAHRESLNRMGVESSGVVRVGPFNSLQSEYLEYHRDQVFLQAQIAS